MGKGEQCSKKYKHQWKIHQWSMQPNNMPHMDWYHGAIQSRLTAYAIKRVKNKQTNPQCIVPGVAEESLMWLFPVVINRGKGERCFKEYEHQCKIHRRWSEYAPNDTPHVDWYHGATLPLWCQPQMRLKKSWANPQCKRSGMADFSPDVHQQ